MSTGQWLMLGSLVFCGGCAHALGGHREAGAGPASLMPAGLCWAPGVIDLSAKGSITGQLHAGGGWLLGVLSLPSLGSSRCGLVWASVNAGCPLKFRV